ncbi:MFS transporter [Candidatus Peregrinibacteria bacterium]|nr:MFS transporter [Candidatus Peregrinibacteria bacterium]
MSHRKEKFIIIFTIFIDVLGLGILIPVLPFYVESFGLEAFGLTLLFSVFSLFSFLSAPLLGALSDTIGRRPVMILSIASTSVGWLFFALARAPWMLFLGRIIDGAAAGNLPIAQSVLTDIAKDEQERMRNFGLMGAVFSVAFIVGPLFGSLLMLVSDSFPFFFVAALSALNVVGAIFFLPETHHERESYGKISLNPFLPLIRGARDTLLRSRYIAWFLFGLGISMLQSIFALYMSEVFHIGAPGIGTIFALMGVLMAINQGILLHRLWLKKFSEAFLESWTFVLFTIAFLLMGTKYIPLFALGILCNVISQSIVRVVISSRASVIAGKHRRGEVFGIMASVLAGAMIVGPIIGGYAFSQNPSFPFFFGAIALFGAFLVMKFSRVSPKKEMMDENQPVPEAL